NRTGLVVGIMTDLAAPGTLDGVDMVVERDGVPVFHQSWNIMGTTERWELPNAFGLVADSGDPRVDIRVKGTLADNPLMQRDATVSLVHEQTLFMRVALVQRCGNGFSCPNPSDTCVEGRCK